jgi:hypothetical protein
MDTEGILELLLQKWSREPGTMLRSTYTAYLVITDSQIY